MTLDCCWTRATLVARNAMNLMGGLWVSGLDCCSSLTVVGDDDGEFGESVGLFGDTFCCCCCCCC